MPYTVNEEQPKQYDLHRYPMWVHNQPQLDSPTYPILREVLLQTILYEGLDYTPQ